MYTLRNKTHNYVIDNAADVTNALESFIASVPQSHVSVITYDVAGSTVTIETADDFYSIRSHLIRQPITAECVRTVLGSDWAELTRSTCVDYIQLNKLRGIHRDSEGRGACTVVSHSKPYEHEPIRWRMCDGYTLSEILQVHLQEVIAKNRT